MNNEVTGKKVGTIASKVMRKLKGTDKDDGIFVDLNGGDDLRFICKVHELDSLAASALTQRQDKPKPKGKSK